MLDWFTTLAAGSELSADAAAELQEQGFAVIPGPVPFDRMEPVVDAYAAAVAAATGDDLRIGSTSTRVTDAGSLIVFNGSTWHGHTANTSTRPRRSLQGAFIPRDGRPGTDFAARMRPETRERLGPLAHHLLAL
jgi:hypothetical protein